MAFAILDGAAYSSKVHALPAAHAASPAPDSPGREGARAREVDIILLPTSDFPQPNAVALAGRLARMTGLRVRAMLAIGEIAPKVGQVDANLAITRTMPVVERLRSRYGDAVVILLTMADINDPGAGTNFLFAQHDLDQRISILSAYRMRDDLLVRWSDALPADEAAPVNQRLIKFLLRSVGEQHYRLPRSTDIRSAMYAPIMSLDDIDAMGTELDGVIVGAQAGEGPRDSAVSATRDWLRDINTSRISAALTPVVVALLGLLGRRRGETVGAWTRLKPGLILWGMALGLLVLASLFSAMLATELFALLRGNPTVDLLLGLFVGLPMIVFLGHGFLYVAFADIRYSSSGVSYRFLTRERVLSWEDIAAIRRHWFLGPRVHSYAGQSFTVWEFFHGFQGFIDCAAANGVEVAL